MMLYLDAVYLLAIFIALGLAAILGLWQYNSQVAPDEARPLVLSETVRAEMAQVRTKILQQAMEEKRARKAEYRRSLRASYQPVSIGDAAEGSTAPGENDETGVSSTPPRNP